MKYALPSGDAGIIKTLDEVLYIACITGSTVHCLTREWKMKQIEIDDTEFVFKKALTQRKFSEVRRLIENDRLRGESILAYLQKKGYPEVALRFVQDPSTRFELAIECGNIDDAFDCARQIDTESTWTRFAAAALMQGNYRYVTEAYKQTLNFEKLMNLFVINGNFAMLAKLAEIARSRDDTMMEFNISMFEGIQNGAGTPGKAVEQRVDALVKAQQYGMAYLTATSNGLKEKAEAIKSEHLEGREIVVPPHLQQPSSLKTPHVFYGPFEVGDDEKYDWPQMEKELDLFDQPDAVPSNEMENKPRAVPDEAYSDSDEPDTTGDWGADQDGGDSDEWGQRPTSPQKNDQNGSGIIADDDDDLELSSDSDDDAAANNEDVGASGGRGSGLVVMPQTGKTARERWLDRSICASDMVAAGSFDLAQESLHRQFGIVNFEPMKTYFMRIYTSCHGVVSPVPNSGEIAMGIRRDAKEKKEYMASIALSMSQCHDMMQSVFEQVTSAKFDEAIDTLRAILHIAPLLVISSSDQLKDARNLVHQAAQYINALRVKIAANACSENEVQRQFELHCYFTHFDLLDAHVFSGLYGAMKLGYKSKYFGTTLVICNRLLELAVSGRVRQDASDKYITQVCCQCSVECPFAVSCIVSLSISSPHPPSGKQGQTEMSKEGSQQCLRGRVIGI